MANDRCNVVELDCESPPVLAGAEYRCRTRCFACGLSVCRNCSAVIPYLRYGRKRLCNNCRAELERDRLRREG
jgi:hypothetical protein